MNITKRLTRNLSLLWLLTLISLSGCMVKTTVPVYRIGVVLPLEGRYSAVGYDAFFATRMAALQRLRSNTMDTYRVELIVINDFGDPKRAIEQAEALALDDTVLAVIGHWVPETTAAALPVYQAAGLPLVTAEGTAVETAARGVFVLDGRPADYAAVIDRQVAALDLNESAVLRVDRQLSLTEAAAQVMAADQDISIGGALWVTLEFHRLTQAAPGDILAVTNAMWPLDLPEGDVYQADIINSDMNAIEPGPYSALAYDATNIVLDAIHQAARAGIPTRQAVTLALQATDRQGVTGSIRFGDDGYRLEAPLHVYRWNSEDTPELLASFTG